MPKRRPHAVQKKKRAREYGFAENAVIFVNGLPVRGRLNVPLKDGDSNNITVRRLLLGLMKLRVTSFQV